MHLLRSREGLLEQGVDEQTKVLQRKTDFREWQDR
jgi:hypothetical protein